MESAKPAVSLRSTSRPLAGSSNIAEMEAMSVATTGTPAARASITANGWPS